MIQGNKIIVSSVQSAATHAVPRHLEFIGVSFSLNLKYCYSSVGIIFFYTKDSTGTTTATATTNTATTTTKTTSTTTTTAVYCASTCTGTFNSSINTTSCSLYCNDGGSYYCHTTSTYCAGKYYDPAGFGFCDPASSRFTGTCNTTGYCCVYDNYFPDYYCLSKVSCGFSG
ncbi:unnamed protein product [Adineta steineri]|uniref:Uncharacterized protein n=1 Tax=Adineta steineri TaxID=433720 RepID=A0A814Z763_9BILA|nr:unnamed protein product [Adineta steineri]CAF1525984.1 unnamed protein product [Adineta steineri]